MDGPILKICVLYNVFPQKDMPFWVQLIML